MQHALHHEWWPEQPVLHITINGSITQREQAFALATLIVDSIEASGYAHVIVILDMTALGQSPSATALLAGNLPETMKIEHLVMINAPGMFRMATMPLLHLRHKLHYVTAAAAATTKAQELLPRLPKR
jgi:hypothetical protein